MVWHKLVYINNPIVVARNLVDCKSDDEKKLMQYIEGLEKDYRKLNGTRTRDEFDMFARAVLYFVGTIVKTKDRQHTDNVVRQIIEKSYGVHSHALEMCGFHTYELDDDGKYTPQRNEEKLQQWIDLAFANDTELNQRPKHEDASKTGAASAGAVVG